MTTEKYLSIKIELSNEEIEILEKAKDIIENLKVLAEENSTTIYNYNTYDGVMSNKMERLNDIEEDLESIVNIEEME